MASQETFDVPAGPTHDPEQHGLWDRYVEADGYRLNEAAFNRARAAGEPIGTCRECGGHLYPMRDTWPDDTSGSSIPWLEYECRLCGHQHAAPAGRRLDRSSRWRRMKSGWLRRRGKALKEPKTTPAT